ncbi:MAG: TrbI F-type domain-containing protein [Acidobacteria bacterium]|nr:TrbI F-type domain-containing protein [Acidobacteriota bacterium]
MLLNLGVAAVLGAGIARYMVETIPRIATVALTELVAEHAEIAANAGGIPEETAAATRAWARALENALRQVADRHGAVLLPIRGVAAGAPDLTAEVRAEIAHALAGGRVLAHGNVPAHGSVPAQDDVLADDHPATREERP